MTFVEQVLLDFCSLDNGACMDDMYSGSEERYRAYKKAVVQLTNDGCIRGASIVKNPRNREIEVVSLKGAYLTEYGEEYVKKLK